MDKIKIEELRKQRADLIAEARDIVKKAEEEAEPRDLNEAEDQKYNELLNKAEELRVRIEREERLLGLEADLSKSQGRVVEPSEPDPANQPGGDQNSNPFASEEYRKEFRSYLQGVKGVEELRALYAGADVSGGFVVAPEQTIMDLIKAVDDIVLIRPLATKYTVAKAEDLGVPVLTADPADADWTSELATGSEDSTMAFGKRHLHPHPLAKRIKISDKLLRSSFLDVEALVRGRLAYKFGISEEKGFLTGNGAQQPLGIFTASDHGISTSRDVSTGNAETSMTFDGLIEAKYNLKQQYWPKARWIFHRDGVKQIAKLKDGEGQYIWKESVRVGEPDRILGFPVHMSEYAPHTFTTGKYVGMLADFSFYWIADALDMTFKVLTELYAETNQIGIIGRMELDGMPVLEEAFVRVKLA
jgi:HK97 family phage major capsid protein